MAFFLGLNVLNDKQHRLTHPHGVTFEMKQSIPKFMQILYSIWYVDWWPLLTILTIRRTWMKSTGARYSNELQRPDLKDKTPGREERHGDIAYSFSLVSNPPSYVDDTNQTYGTPTHVRGWYKAHHLSSGYRQYIPTSSINNLFS